jgi:hypothetical protein
MSDRCHVCFGLQKRRKGQKEVWSAQRAGDSGASATHHSCVTK